MLSDWDIYRRATGTVVSIDAVTPVHGTGSLAMKSLAASDYNVANLVSKGVTYAPVGLLRGALAGIFTCDTTFTMDQGTYPGRVGICCLQEARDVSVSAGQNDSYVLVAERFVSTPSMALSVYARTDSLAPTGGTLLWTAAITPPIALGTPFTLELEWEASAEYAGIRFIVRKGSAMNYSDLMTLTDFIHPLATVPTQSLGEGPCMIGYLGSSNNFACHIDQWRLRA